MTNKTHTTGIIQKVRLGKMRIGANGQRAIMPGWVQWLVANMDLEMLGLPEMNLKSLFYYIMDGQHRYEALVIWLGKGWEKQEIECRVYDGLNDREEAAKIHDLNLRKQYTIYDSFHSNFIAGRTLECEVSAIVEKAKLCISKDKIPGAIGAVGTLVRIYKRSDAMVLSKTLRILRDAFGDAGLESRMMDGIGYLCQRYDGILDEKITIERLAGTRGGVKGLLGQAEILHRKTGTGKAQCIAAAAIEVINKHRGGKKLPSWWRDE